MPTRAATFLFLLLSPHLCLSLPSLNSNTATSVDRRVLHQPFLPVDSSPPPSQTPGTSPPSPKYPFTGSSPTDQSPFFPAYPSPPPPPSPSAFASFPANISSLPIPHSSETHNSVSPALVAVTVALSLCAVAVAAFSLFLYFRGRRQRRFAVDEEDEKPSGLRSDLARPPAPPDIPPALPRKQRNSSSNSSEFLYLGTMVNSRGVDAGNNGGAARRGGAGGSLGPRKMDSPELHPLPPLARQSLRRNEEWKAGEEDEETFYSPRGSASGRESSLAGGSGSTRFFAAVHGEQLIPNNGRSDTNSTSGSSSSETCSLARSASLSISPPVSSSPKKAKPKCPELAVEIDAPPSPQLPPMSFIHSPPPVAYSSPSPERDFEVGIKEEAEESPLLSNASNSSGSSSPVESPRLSPLWAMSGKESPSPPPARDWSVFDRNQLSPVSPVSDKSISSGKSSPIILPTFLGGESKKGSPESTRISNSPASSPHSTASPVSSTASSASRSTPNSPGPTVRSYPASPAPVSDSGRRPQSTPASPEVLSVRSQHSSPEVNRSSNISDHKKGGAVPSPAGPPPPPPPPPPPAARRSESPVKLGAATVEPSRGSESENPVGVCGNETDGSNGEAVDANELNPKLKLKALHWDKVRASSDREMVWDQLRSSSFKLNEKMIETLFVVNTQPKEIYSKPIEPSPRQDNRVLDPKKAQNIAISLRALNVTVEEVSNALLEGNAETLGTELLQCLLKMAPTKEEEWKLREYKDDSPCKLGRAERFLKALIDIPFAFKRVEALLYTANFDSEVEYLKKSFETLEVACEELRNSRMFLKLLEAVLKTGNRMNVGTNRGDAHAFKLDTLLKLVDVKGADGKTTLLHFVVQEMIRIEGARLCNASQAPPKPNDDAKCRKLGLQLVSCLSSELANVKKAAAMDSEALSSEVAKLSSGLASIAEVARLNEKMGPQESSRKFSESMNKFIGTAEEDIIRVQAQESVSLSLVKEITEYFHGDSAKEEAHPFRIFMVVRDFLVILDRVCQEVSMINDRTVITSAHRFPVPVNPMLPFPVNPTLPFRVGRNSSSSDGESSS